MTAPLDLRTSVRTRLLVGMGVMLLPILALAVAGFLTSRAMVEATQHVAQEAVTEFQPVASLAQLVARTATPPHEYLLTGDAGERRVFERLAAEADREFATLLAPDVLGSPDERGLLRVALAEWQQAQRIARELLEWPLPATGSREAARRVKALDGHLERAAAALGKLEDRILAEVHGFERDARAVRLRMNLFMVAVALLSIALAGGAAVVLSRSIVVPVKALQDAMLRFAAGDHSYRVELDGPGEFVQVAETINQLAERLERDQLTGAASRGALQRRLRAEVARARRAKRQISVLMVDVDHFKRVNDGHGHPAGDRALQAVADRLVRALRGVDTVSRYGGEEFAVLLPETPAAGARMIAERLRAAVAAEPVPVAEGVALPITVSVGLAVFPSDAADDAALLAAADRALYAAKQRGRNRVVEAAVVAAAGAAPAEKAEPPRLTRAARRDAGA